MNPKFQTFRICKNYWLGKWFLFQTFEELDSVKDKEYDAQQTRQLIDSLDSPNLSDITISIPEEVE
jgi:hypothetical protein